jgi:uncharacterized protein YjbI with pentapeptide repeats
VGLSGADLSRAIVRGTRLREADFSRLRCQDGSIRDADLSGADFDGADFTNCDLRGSDLSALDPAKVRLKGAIIDLQQALSLVQAMGLDVRAD